MKNDSRSEDLAGEALPGTDRVEAFSDGVFAVVATVLVLDLHVPRLSDHATGADVAAAFRPVLFTILSFTLSFFFVMIVWVNHHQIFHSLDKADRGLLWSNNFLMFWICLLPFPTALLGEYPELPAASICVSAVLCASSVAVLILARHAVAAQLFHYEVSMETRRSIMRRSLVGPPAFFVAALLGTLSPTISIVAMFCIMAYYVIPARIVRNNTSRYK